MVPDIDYYYARKLSYHELIEHSHAEPMNNAFADYFYQLQGQTREFQIS